MSKSQLFEARGPMPVSARELFAWHDREGAFERLTPPWDPVEVVSHEGEGIQEGARIRLRMRLGPLSLPWTARHTRYVPGSLFQDVQDSGPFASWRHTHRMWDEPAGGSVLQDEVEYALPVGPLGRVFGGGYARHRLERMFAYRHTLTREDLRRHAAFAAEPRLTVAVSGASGLVGGALAPFLTTGGHRVRRLVRAAPGAGDIAWAPGRGPTDVAALEGLDAVVHLAGEPIAGRWTSERKARIRQSRVEGTRVLCESLARLSRPPRVLVCASAIGFYGERGDEVLTEASAPGQGFLADVAREWEASTAAAERAGIRVVHLRLGVVLSARGGALAKMVPAFQAAAGGRIGSGQQWMSWVGLEDVLGLIHFALFTPELRGALNAVAPEPVRQEEFARTLGRVLSRPARLPLPAGAVRTLFGEMGEETLLASTRVLPEVATRHGFPFLHPTLEQALRFTLGRTTEGARFGHG
jgi:uncharacterized protein